jgi:hypothetical protein
MADWGVFAVDRGLWGHPFFKPEPFTERESWVWLISAAAWKRMRVGYQGMVVMLERAEFCFALRFLAEKWRWDKDRVDRYLKRLQRHDMIRDTSRDGAKVYFITNYNKFNRIGMPDRDTNADKVTDTIATPPRQHRDKEETFKHSNIESTPSLRSGGAIEKATKLPKRKTQIPSEFPSQADLEAAVKFWTERGRSDLCATVADEAQQFMDRCVANGETAVEWPAKWRTWYRNTMRFNKPDRTNGHGKSRTKHDAAVEGGALAIAILTGRNGAGSHHGVDAALDELPADFEPAAGRQSMR